MKGLQTHTVHIGDSLQKLARMYAIDDWRSIAEINGLHAPFIDSVFGSTEYAEDEQVAKIGSILLIPTGKRVLSSREKEDVQVAAYGEDIDLYALDVVEHRIKGAPFATGSDIATAAGLSNLAQQLHSRLSVKKGALLLHPQYGSLLHLYVGKSHSQENQNKIVFEVERCLRSDFRVKDVSKVEIVFDKETSYIRAEIIPIEPGEPFVLKKLLKEG